MKITNMDIELFVDGFLRGRYPKMKADHRKKIASYFIDGDGLGAINKLIHDRFPEAFDYEKTENER